MNLACHLFATDRSPNQHAGDFVIATPGLQPGRICSIPIASPHCTLERSHERVVRKFIVLLQQRSRFLLSAVPPVLPTVSAMEGRSLLTARQGVAAGAMPRGLAPSKVSRGITIAARASGPALSRPAGRRLVPSSRLTPAQVPRGRTVEQNWWLSIVTMASHK